MPVTSGKGRVLNGSGGDRVKRNNLTEFRGSGWEMVTDWFFGNHQVDYDWRDTADAAKVEKWVFSQDGDYVQTVSIDTVTHQFVVDAESAAFPDQALSNERDIMTVPESGTWGVSHAMTEIVCGPMFNGSLAFGDLNKPQHGIGLRAQEDNGKRRLIIAWHDILFGNPEAINLGVWIANIDGSGFANRQTNITMPLSEDVIVTAASRLDNLLTVTCASHSLIVGDRVNVTIGAEFNVTGMSRVTDVVTCTTDQVHGMAIGDTVRTVFSSIGSFDGVFTITGTPSSTQLQWTDAGANEGPATALGFDITDQDPMLVVVETNPTTVVIDYPGPDKTMLLEGTSNISRTFPYFMEMRLIGNVGMVRCWGRHQTIPPWDDPSRALCAVMDAPQKNFTISQRERTANVATLVIGAHHIVPGERVTISGVTGDSTFHATAVVVSAVAATTVSYLNTGSDVSPVASVGTCNRLGTGTLANQNLIPMPHGTGRISFLAGHVGDIDTSKAVYGAFYGDGDATGDILTRADMTELAATIESEGVIASAPGALDLDGDVESIVELTGDMGLARPIDGFVGAVAELTGTVGLARPIDGSVGAVSELTGTLNLARALDGVVGTVSELTGTLGVSLAVAGTASSVVELSGDLDVVAPTPVDLEGTVEMAFSVEDSNFRWRPPTGGGPMRHRGKYYNRRPGWG